MSITTPFTLTSSQQSAPAPAQEQVPINNAVQAQTQTPVPTPAPALILNDFPVDIVYTFIDGNDPIMIQLKNQAQAQASNQKQQPKRVKLPTNSAVPMRWRQWGELEQSIRSVQKFAPWVRSIFVVSPNNPPKWFTNMQQQQQQQQLSLVSGNTPIKKVNDIDKGPKIEWVPELELTDSKVPLFNSHVPESVLHLIPGLSEHFVYLCDDMFLGAPVSRLDWFSPTGKPRLHVKVNTQAHTESGMGVSIGNNPYRNLPKKYEFAFQGAQATANQLLDILEREIFQNSNTGFLTSSGAGRANSNGAPVNKKLNASLVRQQGLVNQKSMFVPVKPLPFRGNGGLVQTRGNPFAAARQNKETNYRRVRVDLQHCCSPLTRSGYLQVWEHPVMKPVLQETKQSLFRKCTDVHTVYLVSCYLLMTGQAEFFGCQYFPTFQKTDDLNSTISATGSATQGVMCGSATTQGGVMFGSTSQGATCLHTSPPKPVFLYAELLNLENALRKLNRVPHKFYCLNDAHDFNNRVTEQKIQRLFQTDLPHHH